MEGSKGCREAPASAMFMTIEQPAKFGLLRPAYCAFDDRLLTRLSSRTVSERRS